MSQHQLCQAFLAPVTLTTTVDRHAQMRRVTRPSYGASPMRTSIMRRSYLPCMMSDSSSSGSNEEKGKEKEIDPEAEEGGETAKAADILKTLREDSAADMANSEPADERASRAMLGVYRDVDGRSNVWAVEPKEETDTRPQLNKVLLIGFSAAIIIIILLILPTLPLYNPDQA